MLWWWFRCSKNIMNSKKYCFSDATSSTNTALYVVFACLIILQAMTVGVVIYLRRRMSNFLQNKSPKEDNNSQGTIKNLTYDEVVYTKKETSGYIFIDSSKWESCNQVASLWKYLTIQASLQFSYIRDYAVNNNYAQIFKHDVKY